MVLCSGELEGQGWAWGKSSKRDWWHKCTQVNMLKVRVETSGSPHCRAQDPKAERPEQRGSLWLEHPLVYLSGDGQCQTWPSVSTPKALITLWITATQHF